MILKHKRERKKDRNKSKIQSILFSKFWINSAFWKTYIVHIFLICSLAGEELPENINNAWTSIWEPFDSLPWNLSVTPEHQGPKGRMETPSFLRLDQEVLKVKSLQIQKTWSDVKKKYIKSVRRGQNRSPKFLWFSHKMFMALPSKGTSPQLKIWCCDTYSKAVSSVLNQTDDYHFKENRIHLKKISD